MPAPLLRVSLAAAALWAPPAAGLVAEKARYAFGDPDFGSGSEWVHMHIPKVAGESFRRDAEAHLSPPPPGWSDAWPFSAEISYQTARYCDCHYPEEPLHCSDRFDCACSSHAKDSRRVLTMVRDPLHHLLSIYTWCKTAPEQGGRLVFALQFPSFSRWVKDWRSHLSGVHRRRWGDRLLPHAMLKRRERMWRRRSTQECHDPRNLQSSRFANRDEHEKCGTQGPNAAVDLGAALRNMEATEFVGILEAYHESLCLLHAKTLGEVPDDCNCEDEERFGSYKHVEVRTHGTAEHHLADVPESALGDARELVRLDAALYRAAVDRFVREVREVEADHGIKILCKNITVA